jgi:glycosyltransferase involved in cell wall biosynthesis
MSGIALEDLKKKQQAALSTTLTNVPMVTVVIPVLNEEAHIEGVLTQLLLQEYPVDRLEIIVADGGSRDRTCQLVEGMRKQHPQIRLISNPGRRSSAGRNVGFRNGSGEYCIVVDAHCRIDNPKLLAHMVEAFAETGAMALGRPQPLLIGNQSMTAEAIVFARSSFLGHSLRSFIYESKMEKSAPVKASIVSTGAMYRRAVFGNVGFVDESFDACEDVEFNHRVEAAGLPTYFVPSLGIHYYARTSFYGLWRQMLRYGVGRARLVRKHPAAAGLETYVPAGFALLVISAPMMAALGGVMMWLWALPMSLYALLLVIAAVPASRRNRGWQLMPLVIVSCFIIHMGLGVGFLMGAAEPWYDRLRRSVGSKIVG